MSDEANRELERRWRATRAEADWATWARAEARSGRPEAARLLFRVVRWHRRIARWQGIQNAPRPAGLDDGARIARERRRRDLQDRAQAQYRLDLRNARRALAVLRARHAEPPWQESSPAFAAFFHDVRILEREEAEARSVRERIRARAGELEGNPFIPEFPLELPEVELGCSIDGCPSPPMVGRDLHGRLCRRHLARFLVGSGRRPAEVASIVGVARTTVQRWLRQDVGTCGSCGGEGLREGLAAGLGLCPGCWEARGGATPCRACGTTTPGDRQGGFCRGCRARNVARLRAAVEARRAPVGDRAFEIVLCGVAGCSARHRRTDPEPSTPPGWERTESPGSPWRCPRCRVRRARGDLLGLGRRVARELERSARGTRPWTEAAAELAAVSEWLAGSPGAGRTEVLLRTLGGSTQALGRAAGVRASTVERFRSALAVDGAAIRARILDRTGLEEDE